jgi:hypothetical protein
MIANEHLFDAHSAQPDNYARGILLASMMAIVGIFLVFAAVALAILDREPKALTLLIPAALALLVGLTLRGKGKLGLWIMYLWLAQEVCSFLFAVGHALASRSPNAGYPLILGVLWLAFWATIVEYFHNRRREFKTWLGEFNTPNSYSSVR